MNVITIHQVIEALPDRGSKIIELQRQYPELGYAIVGQLKDAQRRGQVEFNDLTGRWRRPGEGSVAKPPPPPPARLAEVPIAETPPERPRLPPALPLDQETPDMGKADDSANFCSEPGCTKARKAGTGQRYCEKHGTPEAKKARRAAVLAAGKGSRAGRREGRKPMRRKVGRKLEPAIAAAVGSLRAKAGPRPPAQGSALEHQVGGDHYKSFAIQPVEFIAQNKLSFCAGNVVKYVCRHHVKGGAEDLDKAIHYLQLERETLYGKAEA